MTWSIPIGEVFEAFINWLTDSFSVVFDGISAVLNFAIEALENVLLLNHAQVYPAVILVIALGLMTWYLSGRYGKAVRYGATAAMVVLVAVVEVWRYQQLEYAVNAESGERVAVKLDTLRENLEAAYPEDYSLAGDVVDDLLKREDLDRQTSLQLSRAQNELDDLRSGRFDDAVDELVDLLEEADDGDIKLSREDRQRLQEPLRQYRALSLTEDLERLADDLREIEDPRPRQKFLNERAYNRLILRLKTLSELDADWAGEGDLQAALKEAAPVLKTFNPGRLSWFPWLAMLVLLCGLAYISSGRGLTLFTAVGFLLVVSMGFWHSTMESLALVLSATFFALLIGIPVGIAAARSNVVDGITRPILDFMQTMPAFVYLIPAVLFFGLGKVPGAMATLIFAMPPAVRLTSLGIRQVPTEVVEACLAFGSTPRQMLYKAQLPIARPTILAGLNQTIMLALSMVVIGGMIGAGGLGQEVLSGITQLKIGLGFESGISVVILAIFLDRVTQSFGGRSG